MAVCPVICCSKPQIGRRQLKLKAVSLGYMAHNLLNLTLKSMVQFGSFVEMKDIRCKPFPEELYWRVNTDKLIVRHFRLPNYRKSDKKFTFLKVKTRWSALNGRGMK